MDHWPHAPECSIAVAGARKASFLEDRKDEAANDSPAIYAFFSFAAAAFFAGLAGRIFPKLPIAIFPRLVRLSPLPMV